MSSEWPAASRAFLRAANGLGARRAERLWAAGCSLAGRLTRVSARRWASRGNDSVVVIAPHPDDDALGCAGTLLRHRAAGDRTRIVVMTDGGLSRAYGFDPPALVVRRREEAAEAARRMGAELDWLGFPEGGWSTEAAADTLRLRLAELAPSIVYAPSAVDYHPAHRRVAAALASALATSAPAAEVRVYTIQVPLTPLLVNLVNDVSDLAQPLGRVLAAYATQRETIAYTLRLRRYAARFYGTGTEVEAFCAMPAALYSRLHTRPAAQFRGIQPRAWTDPLAALSGLAERAAWRRALASSDGGAASPGVGA
ncbi:MAG TPA: PIG-L family deacetylase [Polyangia bacterium]|nr:PIG-L family deacetylase [Polyangia bacterium]